MEHQPTLTDHAQWHARWAEGRIGFHEGRPNSFLEHHVSRLGRHARVLVPLCGKTLDLTFLAAQGHQVIGVELVEDAVRAFFTERGQVPERTQVGPFASYRHGSIGVLAGDVFEITADHLGAIDAIYDRAALVALPPELRRGYVSLLRSLVPPGTPLLLVTIEYPQDQAAGPPYAVLEPELRALFRGCTIDLLEETPIDGRFREAGIPGFERCFAITLR